MPWFVPTISSTLHCIPMRFVSQKQLKTLPANFPTPILSPQSSILYFGGLRRGKTLKQWRLYCDRWHRKSWLQGPVLRSGLGVPPVLCRSPRVGGIVQTLRGTRAPRWVPPFVYWAPVLCAFAWTGWTQCCEPALLQDSCPSLVHTSPSPWTMDMLCLVMV